MSGGGYILDNQLALIGEPAVLGFGDDRFAISEIPRDLATDIIARNHYSRRVYSASTLHFGVFLDAPLLGALQFGYAMNPASAGSVVEGTAIDEYLELNRMWLADELPRNSESRAIACAIRAIRRMKPKVRWIQSFADERCGALGVVYQACNFLYLGEHVATFWELDGEFFHNSLMTNTKSAHLPRARRLLANRDRARAVPLRQFRYIYFMQRRFARGLRHPVLPYPKRAALGSKRTKIAFAYPVKMGHGHERRNHHHRPCAASREDHPRAPGRLGACRGSAEVARLRTPPRAA